MSRMPCFCHHHEAITTLWSAAYASLMSGRTGLGFGAQMLGCWRTLAWQLPWRRHGVQPRRRARSSFLPRRRPRPARTSSGPPRDGAWPSDINFGGKASNAPPRRCFVAPAVPERRSNVRRQGS
jgi:hypothetical protein